MNMEYLHISFIFSIITSYLKENIVQNSQTTNEMEENTNKASSSPKFYFNWRQLVK